MDLDKVSCRRDDAGAGIAVTDIGGRLGAECEPYILPLFSQPVTRQEFRMGQNVSWLCKALGSPDVEIRWRVPSRRPSGSVTLGDGQCSPDGRHCVAKGTITIQFLHPTDSGRYVCVAKSKFGQDQRETNLRVKVRRQLLSYWVYYWGLKLNPAK